MLGCVPYLVPALGTLCSLPGPGLLPFSCPESNTWRLGAAHRRVCRESSSAPGVQAALDPGPHGWSFPCTPIWSDVAAHLRPWGGGQWREREREREKSYTRQCRERPWSWRHGDPLGNKLGLQMSNNGERQGMDLDFNFSGKR